MQQTFVAGVVSVLRPKAGGPLSLGIRVSRKIRVWYFGFLEIRVLRIVIRYLPWKEKTRCFGYPKFRVWVFPEPPELHHTREKIQKISDLAANKSFLISLLEQREVWLTYWREGSEDVGRA
jgi:hypothetical protein